MQVAVVLPPREVFSPAASGAVGLLVHRLARVKGPFAPLVVGGACAAPFADVAFAGVTPRGWGSVTRRYAAGVDRVLGAPTLIEVHNRAELALHLARWRRDIPVSLFLHNDPTDMRGLRTQAARRTAVRRLAGIVCVSHFVAQRFGAGAKILPNCLDLAALPPPRKLRDRVLLFAGRLVADKGADDFVAACGLALPQLPGWRAEMIGADRFGPGSPRTPFVERLHAAAAQAGVALLGYRPHGQVMEAMARAAIVVAPSRWAEPFGLVALEAMANGAALICSGSGGMGEVVGDAAVIVPPDDVPALAAAMVRLASDPAAWVARAQAGRARAQAYDVGAAAAALDAYRRSILGPAFDRGIEHE